MRSEAPPDVAREMNLTEWCAKLPEDHAVNRELAALRWRDEHLLRAWWQRLVRRAQRALTR